MTAPLSDDGARNAGADKKTAGRDTAPPPATASAPAHPAQDGPSSDAHQAAQAAAIDDTELEAAIGRWLTPRKDGSLRQRFPRAMERLYRRETAPIKLVALRRSSLAAQFAVVLLTPMLWQILTDQRPLFLLIWVGVLMPASAASYLTLRTSWPPMVKMASMLLSGLVDAVCISVLAVRSIHVDPSAYLGGMLLLVLQNVIEGSFDSRLATAFAMAMAALFGATVAQIPSLAGNAALVLLVLFSACALFAVSACWRLDMEARRSFALMLRERLQQATLKRLNGELHDLSRRDPLTGLANRRAHDEWVQAAWRQAVRSRLPLGLIIVDIDYFKAFNDFYGHSAGDSCLQSVARCLADHARGRTDCLSRLGGEEFAALLPGADLDGAGDVADRLRRAIEALQLPHLGRGTASIVTISCGVASLHPNAGSTPAALFTLADAALYAAKQGGRNRVCLGSPDPGATLAAAPIATLDPPGLASVPGHPPR